MKPALILFVVLSVSVAAAQTPLSISVPPLQGSVNQPFNATLGASGGTPPYIWVGTSLPPGLRLTPSGVIAGTVVAANTWVAQLTVTDAQEQTAEAQANFTFLPALVLTTQEVFSFQNQPVAIASISSFPPTSVTLTLSDPWIRFEKNSDTTCTQTSPTVTVPTGSAGLQLNACLFNPPNERNAYALIRATAPGFASVADGILFSSSTSGLSAGGAVDITSGAGSLLVDDFSGSGRDTVVGPPAVARAPSSGANWLMESDDCAGTNFCKSSVAANQALLAGTFPGEQLAARLTFTSTSGATDSALVRYKYTPTVISITSPASFSGFVNWGFSAPVSASGGTAPYTWSAAGLPPGLEMSADGLLAGTVMQAGTWKSYINGTDSFGYTVSQPVVFSFQTGAPALALEPRTGDLDSGFPPHVIMPQWLANVSSSPAGARVTLTIGAPGQFGFPNSNDANASCGQTSPTTTISTPSPQPVYICQITTQIPLDGATRAYCPLTASAPAYPPVTVEIPLIGAGNVSVALPPPIDLSATGSQDVTVTVLSNNQSGTDYLAKTPWTSNAAWINVAPVNTAVDCAGRISCSFTISALAGLLNAPVAGAGYSGSVTFSTNLGYSAGLQVSYRYPGAAPSFSIASPAFSGTSGQAFNATVAAAGGVGPLAWSSADLPPGLAISPDGTISGNVSAPGFFSSQLSVHDQANHVTPGAATFDFSGLNQIVMGDFDGDGWTDYAVWRPSNGTWYVLPSSTPGAQVEQQWGLLGDIPVAGDFDGDGKTDYAVWRPSTGTWYIMPSSRPGAQVVQQWGLPGDIPVTGDFDGDGKTDYAVWRPLIGTWFVLPSGNPGAQVQQQWGLPGDIPVAGDFDGDGKTDYAVWRPSTGTWFVLPSGNPGAQVQQQWGLAGDIPVAGDFDRDRHTDFSVWRPSTGTWLVVPSSNPGLQNQQQWGLPGDLPQ